MGAERGSDSIINQIAGHEIRKPDGCCSGHPEKRQIKRTTIAAVVLVSIGVD